MAKYYCSNIYYCLFLFIFLMQKKINNLKKKINMLNSLNNFFVNFDFNNFKISLLKEEYLSIFLIILIAFILAFFLPPLGVLIKDGIKTSFFVNIILTLLGWIPGVIHALYVILRK